MGLLRWARRTRWYRPLLRFGYSFKYLPFFSPRRFYDLGSEERGFVVVQIDGLSRPRLEEALERRLLRHTSKLLRRGQVELRDFPSGCPSSTLYAQAGMMYGANDMIPAFRWFEKKEFRLVHGNHAESVQYVRDRWLSQYSGILSGGASLGNMFDGDAAHAMLSLTSTSGHGLFHMMGGLRFALFFLLHPVRTLGMGCSFLSEIVESFWDRSRSRREGRATMVEGIFPIVRAIANVMLRELQTVELLGDVFYGVPYIFTTYLGYDELGHHYGPASRPAMEALRYIDRRIGEIHNLVRFGAGRPYDLIILSDHGLTESVPLQQRLGRTLGAFLVEALRKEGRERVVVSGGREERTLERAGDLVRRVEQYGHARGRLLGKSLSLLARRLRQRYREMDAWQAEKFYVSDDCEVVVTYTGPLGHLYFPGWEEQAFSDQVREEYPFLEDALLYTGQIGLVMTRERDGRVRVAGPRGLAFLGPDGLRVEKGENPLAGYGPPERIARYVRELLVRPNGGDLVLMGRLEDDGKIISFDDHVGCHGGFGGDQCASFLLAPRAWGAPVFTDPRDLYGVLAERYRSFPATRPVSPGGYYPRWRPGRKRT